MYFTKCVPATLVVACLSVVGGLACWAATEATFSGPAFGEGGSTTITPNSLALGGGGCTDVEKPNEPRHVVTISNGTMHRRGSAAAKRYRRRRVGDGPTLPVRTQSRS
jgi:hypothetical protein